MRLFKKADGKEEIFKGEKSIPLPSRFLSKIEPKKENPLEKYLRELNMKILSKEKELQAINSDFNETKRQLDITFVFSSAEIKNKIDELESVLKIKRSEKEELLKPINARSKELKERQHLIEERSKSLDEYQQAIFERERTTERKLEEIQNLSDSLGEIRTRLSVKQITIESHEKLLKDREMQYLYQSNLFNENVKKSNEELRQKQYETSIKELDLQGKEENLMKREKSLSEGHIWLDDQRKVLARAWNELKKKV